MLSSGLGVLCGATDYQIELDEPNAQPNGQGGQSMALEEWLKLLFMSAAVVAGGFLALHMPQEFLRGYDRIKNRPEELRSRLRLRPIVGYPMIVVGSLLLLRAIVGVLAYL